MEPEAFIFDIGNVLLGFDYGRAYDTLRAAGAPDFDRAAVLALGRVYERGDIGTEDFLGRLEGIVGGTVSREILVEAWNDIFHPIEPAWDLVEGLRGKYPLYLLSNTNELQHAFIMEKYPRLGMFDSGVFSYLAGCMKPEPEIFGMAIRQFGVDPARTVYVDDLAENIWVGRRAGLRGVCYDAARHGELVGELRAAGVQCV